jgi:hypothetical protein
MASLEISSRPGRFTSLRRTEVRGYWLPGLLLACGIVGDRAQKYLAPQRSSRV